MGYSIIVLVGSVALIAWFDFASEASLLSKVAASAVFLLSLACCCCYWLHGASLTGLFMLVALSIYITLYRAYEQAHRS